MLMIGPGEEDEVDERRRDPLRKSGAEVSGVD